MNLESGIPSQEIPSEDIPRQDIHAQKLEINGKESSLKDSRFFWEAAGLLIVWSVLVINEGGIRFIQFNPSVDLGADGRPPKLVPVLGGLFEVIFGLIGLALGVAGFVFKYYNTAVTYAAMAIQTLFGYYVFIVYVFLIPAYQAIDLTEPTLPGLSLGQERFLITLGILTGFHFCLSLQGGQIVFMARLVSGATGRNFLMQRTGNRMRAIFWHMNLLLAGLWTLIFGIIINREVGGGTIDGAFAFPPQVGRMSGFTIFTGIMMILNGMAGIFFAVLKKPIPYMYYIFAGWTFLYMFLNFTIVQLGLIDGAPTGPVAVHNGLVFMTAFLGPYFLRLADIEQHTV